MKHFESILNHLSNQSQTDSKALNQKNDSNVTIKRGKSITEYREPTSEIAFY